MVRRPETKGSRIGDEDSLFLPMRLSIYLAVDGKKTGSEEAAG